jgi:hypothetical protein
LSALELEGKREGQFRVNICMPSLEGSPFEAIYYSEPRHELVTRFREIRSAYVYEGVPPEEYEALVNADSVGRYFNTHIRDQFRYHRQ